MKTAGNWIRTLHQNYTKDGRPDEDFIKCVQHDALESILKTFNEINSDWKNSGAEVEVYAAEYLISKLKKKMGEAAP